MGVYTFGRKQKSGSYLLVIRYTPDSDVESKVMSLPGYRLKNKSMTADYTELVAEVRLSGNSTHSADILRSENGVKEVSLMRSANGSAL